MRTPRISQDTAKIINATSISPRRTTRTTRTSLATFAYNPSIKPDGQVPVDIEDVIPLSKKRKREVSTRAPIKSSSDQQSIVKTEVTEVVTFSPAKAHKVRKPARQIRNEDTGEVEIHPPNDWAEVYAAVKEMRTTGTAQNAAVDTMGCERLADEKVPPIVKRYHTLTALMLSSQTKDTTNAATMKRLRQELPPYQDGAPGGLNLENILAVDPELLNELIWAVGFHNNKTKYIKATAEILRDKFNGDIPDTIEGLISLPGVGPKMGYLCLSAAFGRTEGIGVDVHVHRITNLWGWHTTKGPEQTRLALQAWLPQELWHEINWLLVGLGQTVCLPVGRKCGDCELGLRGLCKAADRSKVAIGRKLKEEQIKVDGEGSLNEKVDTVKEEEYIYDAPITSDPKLEHMPEVKFEEEVPIFGSCDSPESREIFNQTR